MRASRLPGKMMLDLHGQPVINWVFKRVKKAKKLSGIVFALPDTSADDCLAKHLHGLGAIALQTGLLDKNEGVPTYGRVGEFTGFRSMSGNTYTVPDFAAMSAIAESSSGRGLHARAESQTAVDRMLQFTVGGDTRNAAPDATLLSTFGMFAVVSLLCMLVLR